MDRPSLWSFSNFNASEAIKYSSCLCPRSGLLRPPFVHNGFHAQLKFSAVKSRNESEEENKNRDTTSDIKSYTVNNLAVQHDEAILAFVSSKNLIEKVTRPNQIYIRKISPIMKKVFTCRDEITEPNQSGLISSSTVVQNSETCSLVFTGEQRDLLMIRLNTLSLR